ncbi:MAG: response regulator [Gammaproteobacteria bacterium]|nr:MAG: response regulator [Gammaproteobacteria bacterium]
MSKILIVDDSPSYQTTMKQSLEKNGYDTLVATNGEDALAAAKNDKPDLILMDVVMPGMSGFQATRKLNQDPDTASIPVIIVSSKDQETDKIWGQRQGAIAYLVKPVEEQELIATVKSVLTA